MARFFYASCCRRRAFRRRRYSSYVPSRIILSLQTFCRIKFSRLPLPVLLAWRGSAAFLQLTCAFLRPRIVPQPWDEPFSRSTVVGYGPSPTLCRLRPLFLVLDTVFGFPHFFGGPASSFSLVYPWSSSINRAEQTSANALSFRNGSGFCLFCLAKVRRFRCCCTIRSRFRW